jgi:hypothetical protein
MHTLEYLVGAGYKPGAPTPEAEDIDARMAESQPCRKCGGPMHYEGYHRRHNGHTEYVALAVCNRCGYEISF